MLRNNVAYQLLMIFVDAAATAFKYVPGQPRGWYRFTQAINNLVFDLWFWGLELYWVTAHDSVDRPVYRLPLPVSELPPLPLEITTTNYRDLSHVLAELSLGYERLDFDQLEYYDKLIELMARYERVHFLGFSDAA